MELLKGKTAIVTGGTRGIGLAVVKKFLENGAKVALLGSRQETVDKAMAALKEENPNYPVIGMCPSLSNPDQIHETFKKLKENFGCLDLLV